MECLADLCGCVIVAGWGLILVSVCRCEGDRLGSCQALELLKQTVGDGGWASACRPGRVVGVNGVLFELAGWGCTTSLAVYGYSTWS